MTVELTMLFWAVVLAFLQVLVSVILCTKQAGLTELGRATAILSCQRGLQDGPHGPTATC